MPFVLGGGLKNYLNNRLGQDKWAPLERLKKYSWIQSSKTNILGGGLEKISGIFKVGKGEAKREKTPSNIHLIIFAGCSKCLSYMKTERARSSEVESPEFSLRLRSLKHILFFLVM